ncbi:CAP domain-containing protein [Paenisporosarcina sp.]|uniref:CAP domain-containing protein n=1 Tax=Paenisporosarcina sp. TaxID=1932001 RepID=UPI003C772D83
MKKMLLGLTMGAMVFSVGQATTAEASFSSPTCQTQNVSDLSTRTQAKQVDFSTIEKQMLEKLYAQLAAAGFTPAQIKEVAQKPATPEASKPATKPAAPVTKPAAPVTKPAVPVTKPAAPVTKPAAPVTKPAAPASSGNVSSIEQQVLTLTNQERAKGGLKALATDSALMNSAREKSADMSKNNYFSHTSPTLGSPFDQMKAKGIQYKAAAENIAMGQQSAAEVVKGWMESPGHRANIMNGSFTHIGIGYDANGNYWTQQFIQK